MSSAFDLSVEAICGMSRNREGAWGRAVVGYVVRRLCRYSKRDVADSERPGGGESGDNESRRENPMG